MKLLDCTVFEAVILLPFPAVTNSKFSMSGLDLFVLGVKYHLWWESGWVKIEMDVELVCTKGIEKLLLARK